jgi:hypothetical protein
MRAFAMVNMVAAVTLLALPASAEAQRSDDEWLDRCRNRELGDSRRETFCEVRVERLRSTGSLAVDGHRNGGVTVYGWDGDSVVVHARIQTRARTQSEARDLAEDVRIVLSDGQVRADGPDNDNDDHWAVHFVIGVPRRTNLRADVMNGPLSVEELDGRIELTARNGPVSIEGLSGDVTARVRNGPLQVELTGSRWEGRGLDAEAVNGPVTLRIPRRYSARLETGTSNGPLIFDYPITLQGRISRDITTTLGEGGATVRVVTRNGPLVVKERN